MTYAATITNHLCILTLAILGQLIGDHDACKMISVLAWAWIGFVVFCRAHDWTEHENLGSSTALRWIEGYCIGHKPVTPSKDDRTKGITALTVWLWWNWKCCCFWLFLPVFCFGIFAIGLCLTEQEAKAPFFADQPVHTVRAFDQSYLISPKSPVAANFQDCLFWNFRSKQNTEGNPRGPKKDRNQLYSYRAFEFWKNAEVHKLDIGFGCKSWES